MATELAVNSSGATNLVLGPFLDASDSKTPLTGLAGTMTVKNILYGGSAANATLDGSITHLGDGFYKVPLDSDVLIFPGNASFYVTNPSVHLPVWKDVNIVADTWPEIKWGSAPIPADVTRISGDSTAADNLEAAFDGTGYATLNNAIRDAVAGTVVETEGSYTLKQVLSIALAVLAGQTDDAGATIKTPNGAATRVAATLSSNERTAMTLTPSS